MAVRDLTRKFTNSKQGLDIVYEGNNIYDTMKNQVKETNNGFHIDKEGLEAL